MSSVIMLIPVENDVVVVYTSTRIPALIEGSV